MSNDTDLLALGAMIRLALTEIAKLKAPKSPEEELRHMRQRLYEEIAGLPVADFTGGGESRGEMLKAITHLMPLGSDRERMQ